MKRIYGYRCTLCGREYPYGPELMTCPACGEKGILDIIFNYNEVKKCANEIISKLIHEEKGSILIC